jgi:pyruvate formate lyase activating enzyme
MTATKRSSALVSWFGKHLGPDVPLHFSAFHPDYKMTDVPPTPPATLRRARKTALDAGLHYVYVGNVHDAEADSTWCPAAGNGSSNATGTYSVSGTWTGTGVVPGADTRIAGVFEERPGSWGAKRLPVDMKKARSQ